MLNDVAEIIKALALLAWPLVVFWGLRKYHSELSGVFKRVKKGKILGQEFETEERLNRLEISVGQAAEHVPLMPERLDEPKGLPLTSDDTRDLLADAARSPKVGLIQVSADIERELRQFLLTTGWHTRIRPASLPVMLKVVAKNFGLPETLVSSVQEFWHVRNRIVHGHNAAEHDIVRAFDLGLSLLRTLRAIPREINTVHHPGAEVYTDAGGARVREGVLALILKTVSSNGKEALRVYPTTRRDYQKGKQVAWEWNSNKMFEESWYRNPDTGKIEYAWGGSMEFIGRHLDEA